MGKQKKSVLIIITLVMLGAVYFFALPMVLGKSGGLPIIITTSQQAAQPIPVAEEKGLAIETEERVFNLADADVYRYLKAQVVLEVSGTGLRIEELSREDYERAQAEFIGAHPIEMVEVEDTVTSILTSKTSEEIITPAGKEALKSEIKREVGKIFDETKILNVYFTQFVIQ